MMAFSPPPLSLLSPVVVMSVGHVRELWPLFPHCEQLRDIFFPSQRKRERERDFGMKKVKRRRKERFRFVINGNDSASFFYVCF
jgi:hypothetical protein